MISRATTTGLVLLALWGCDSQTPTTGTGGSSGAAPPAQSREPDADARMSLPPDKGYEAIPGTADPQPEPRSKPAQ